MSLRARLTGAFLAVVLGPVLLGAIFVGGTVATVSRARVLERLDHGTAAVQTSIVAHCQRLAAAAQAAAVLTGGGDRPDQAELAVKRGLAPAIHLEDASGQNLLTTAKAPAPPWADCAASSDEELPMGTRYSALAARVEMRAESGQLLGYAYAAEPIDSALLSSLGTASGGTVVQLPTGGTRAVTDAIEAAAVAAQPGKPTQMGDGRWVRRIDPSTAEPLHLALAVPANDPDRLYAVLLVVVVAAGLAAVAAAWWLARTTTEPLVELAEAVDRVADGDLEARVPVRGHDEVGRLGATFNRMTREMQAYVQALTASRDQLRGNLGLLGDTLSSTHDLDRILEVILQTSLAATSADAGVVLLAETQGPGWAPVLAARCGVGLDVDVADLRVGLGEGLLGGVAVSGEPCRGRLDPSLVLAPHEPRCRTFVAVPFTGPLATGPDGEPVAGLLGVLALYDRLGGDDFDDADLATLRTFAGQAGVAVENVLLHDEAQRLSLTDPLTGLWNYRHLCDCLRLEVERASRFGRTLGVLALDLDRFKDVNDTYGHHAGDAVLAELAVRLRQVVREVDLVFRRGGEELVVLLPETDAAGSITAAQRVGEAIRSSPFTVEVRGRPDLGQLLPVTISIGVAVYPDHGSSGPAVLEAADEALYAAKAAGRDTYALAWAVGGASGGSHPPRQSRGG